MKETYLKIFSNAKQLAGLGELTPLEQEAINQEGDTLAEAANMAAGVPDGNENSPFYVPPFGNTPGYSCSGPGYQTNGWRYPVDAENGLFIMLDQDNLFQPCAGAAMA